MGCSFWLLLNGSSGLMVISVLSLVFRDHSYHSLGVTWNLFSYVICQLALLHFMPHHQNLCFGLSSTLFLKFFLLFIINDLKLPQVTLSGGGCQPGTRLQFFFNSHVQSTTTWNVCFLSKSFARHNTFELL